MKSDHYPSGYYPYSAPPKGANPEVQKRHAYDVGNRIGQDDFNHGHSKHFTRHKDMYDDETHHNFALGYEHGYDKARDHSRPSGGSQTADVPLTASKGQGQVIIKRGAATVSTVRTASPDVENYSFINGDSQIVVKSRGRHGPATVELFDVRTGSLRDKVLAYAIANGNPSWARGMED